MWAIAIEVVPSVVVHGHVGARTVDEVEVDLECLHARVLCAEGGDHAPPRVDCESMPPRAPLVAVLVVQPGLRGGDDVRLALDGARAQQGLPMRLARFHRKRRRHKQHLCAVQKGQLLVELREA